MIDRLSPPVMPHPLASKAPARNASVPSFGEWLSPSVPDDIGAQPSISQNDGDFAAEQPLQLDLTNGIPQAFVEHVFEFHVRHPRGEAEVIALPWRLAASGALAQMIAGTIQDVGSHDSRATASGPHATSGVGTTNMATGLFRTAAASVELTDAGRVLAQASLPIPHAGMTTVESLPATPSAQSSSIAAPWLTRLIRWIEQQGHDPTVWIRDYRLDDAAARNLVETLRSQAREQGIQLERIVVNARELWRSTPPAIAQENGACP